MKKGKSKNTNQGKSGSSPIEMSTQDLDLIRARETSRVRRSNIEWFSMS